MPLAVFVDLIIHFTSRSQFLRVPIPPLTCLASPLLARFMGDVLHVNRAMVARVRPEETIVTVRRLIGLIEDFL